MTVSLSLIVKKYVKFNELKLEKYANIG